MKKTSQVHPIVPFFSLAPYFLLSFGLAWGIVALFVFLPDQMNNWVGPLTGEHPLFFLAVYSPAIAAFTVVIWHTGIAGWRSYLTRLFLWRCHWAWYALMVFGIPLLFMGGALLKGNLADGWTVFPSLNAALLALFFTAIKGPIEEFGWRGLALPILQRRLAPFWAAIILGVIWGIWHLPAFILSGTPQSSWSFMPFFLGAIAISVIVTPMFNQSGGSILLPMLFHFQTNNPFWPDAQPYDIIFFVGAAIIVVILKHKHFFSPHQDSNGQIVTRVVPVP